MQLSYINELLEKSYAAFMCVDKRECLYENMEYIPVTSRHPIVWEDKDSYSEAVFDITNSGDLSVTQPIAEVFMSFDPYGVVALPNQLECMDGLSEQKRYIIAINNEIDVIDEEKSVIKHRVRYYDPEEDGYDVPLEAQKPIHSIFVKKLYIDKEKLKSYPKHKTHIFRVKGTNNFFFSLEVYDALYEIALEGLAAGLTAFPFDIDEEAPRR